MGVEGSVMIRITPTPNQIKEAERIASGVMVLQGSITRGNGNSAGALGEVIVRDYMKYEHTPTQHYDLSNPRTGRTVDVKTKRCTSAPKNYYECSVAAHGSSQECDDYVFVRVLNNLQQAWILGTIPKDEYYAKAVRYKKGDMDESNNFIFKADCYNLPISELWKIEQGC